MSVRLVGWFESLRLDAAFGWRQMKKRKLISVAAIVSLAFGVGACMSAFRLIDALLFRPLPVATPDRLYVVLRQGIGWDGKPSTDEFCQYPLFLRMRTVVQNQADLLAISPAERVDLTYGSDQEIEKAYLQYVSGWMFPSFGLRPALGRLLSENDDVTPGAHPYAVISYNYWKRRFGQDPQVVGRTFHMGGTLYTIVGVSEQSFTGTEPGKVTAIFIPTMMHPYVARSDASVLRVFALLKAGAAVEPVRGKLEVTSRTFEEERAKTFVGIPKESLDNFLNQRLRLQRAPSGVSDVQNENRRSLAALALVVSLVLLIACANVANLMTVQAVARGHEMALRTSIGAGRWRLVQLLVIESVWIASLAAGLGALFAWWSAPFVVSRINPPDNPVQLVLPADWRVLAFGVALTFGVTVLFGLLPALRVCAVNPLNALKAGEGPHFRRGLMHALIAFQVAFCFLVLFACALFVATFERLSHQRTGFSAERILTLDTFAQQGQSPVVWSRVTEHLREMPGVQMAALASWPLLDGNSVNSYVSINEAPPSPTLAYFLRVSPGWIETMNIALVDGRDFLPSETAPGAAIVNESFAKTYFNGERPVGKTFARSEDQGVRRNFQIVGLVRDTHYRSLREPNLPVAYIPFQGVRANGDWVRENWGTFIVRTSGANPLALATGLRQEMQRADPEFRVSRVRTQQEINEAQTVRERLLAVLALFFAVVALVLAGVGLYGLIYYSVLQRQREIGIRIALGAAPSVIVRIVTVDVLLMVLLGAVAGLAFGLRGAKSIEILFYQVKATDLTMLAFPSLTILMAALLAALPAVLHAVRIDPMKMLRAE